MDKRAINIRFGIAVTLLVSAICLPLSAIATAFDSGIPSGWSCTGNCGTLGADGVVTTSPEGGAYGWVSSSGGVSGQGLGLGSETNGTVLHSNVFAASAGDDLQFYFNFVTSDGAGFADYGWAAIRNFFFF